MSQDTILNVLSSPNIFIEKLLEKKGITNLTQDQKDVYVPEFASLLEQRISLALNPKKDENHKTRFVSLLENESTTAEEWNHFWHEAVPNFEEMLKEELRIFSTDMLKSFE